MSDEPNITYGVKELLERMDRRLTDIVQLMGTKADRSDVERLASKVEIHSTDIDALKLAKANEEKQQDHRHRLWGLLIGAAGVIAAAVTALLTVH